MVLNCCEKNGFTASLQPSLTAALLVSLSICLVYFPAYLFQLFTEQRYSTTAPPPSVVISNPNTHITSWVISFYLH